MPDAALVFQNIPIATMKNQGLHFRARKETFELTPAQLFSVSNHRLKDSGTESHRRQHSDVSASADHAVHTTLEWALLHSEHCHNMQVDATRVSRAKHNHQVGLNENYRLLSENFSKNMHPSLLGLTPNLTD
jgi:hypothetical protein